MRKLPPLRSLQAFEAVARHCSFKDAAQELNVTPTALSHQIRTLEEACGRQLFARRPRPVRLTAAGQLLYPALRRGFDSFADALSTVAEMGGTIALRITSPNAFASRSLVPRLSLWHESHSDIALQIIGTDAVLDLNADEADVAIRYAHSAPKGLVCKEIARDAFYPVASPGNDPNGNLTGIQPVDIPASTGKGTHTFSFSQDGENFLLDGEPFQIRSAEMHPARIPAAYWQHRILMAKAMGMNCIALYVMWNYHETSPGIFDFRTGNRDIEAFIRLCQQEGMWVLLRPGPYICGEWDLGGIPSYLLSYPDIQLRTDSAHDPRYMSAVARYIRELSPRIEPLLVTHGGPILMIQIENEFGSYAANPAYLEEIRQLWLQEGVQGPFYTEDGIRQLEQNRTNVTGGAIALSNGDAEQIAAVRQQFPAVPAMAGEVYPGWLTHWGDETFNGTAADISGTLDAFMQLRLSFNLYVIHGGTSFGFYAGANVDADSGEYQPDITSYDYAAPISEQGVATSKYMKYRGVIARYLSTPLPDIPKPVPTIGRKGSYALLPELYASVWDNLPAALPTGQTVDPQPFEMYGQAFGFALYRKKLRGYRGGVLDIKDVHDYATVFVGEQYVGGVSRAFMPKHRAQPLNVMHHAPLTLPLGLSSPDSDVSLDILVEGMGRVNYGHAMLDRKGILEPVTLEEAGVSSDTLTGWEVFLLPMDAAFIANLRTVCVNPRKAGLFFKATLSLDTIGDTYLDMRHWTKGLVWVNGHNLGRYWNIGPQKRLYCPAPWLRLGDNEVVIFDLHQIEAKPVELARTLS